MAAIRIASPLTADGRLRPPHVAAGRRTAHERLDPTECRRSALTRAVVKRGVMPLCVVTINVAYLSHIAEQGFRTRTSSRRFSLSY